MEELQHIDPESITPKHIDIEDVLANKGVMLPKWMVRWVERLLHLDEINHVVYKYRYKFGLDFVHAFLEGKEEHDLDVAAKAAVALEKFAEKRQLDGFAYYYEGQEGTPTRELVTNFIVGNSLLTAAGFPMCGEFDLKNCVAMMIFDRLDIGGSFAEFHPIDFGHDTVLVGHDGPHHLNIAAKKPVLRSLKKYHGKPGKGAGVEFNIKEGPITMMSLGLKRDGQFKFIIAEGESLKGPIPPTGNTNTHGKFLPDVRTFLRRWCMEGPTHHFALGIGHHAAELKKLAKALGIEAVVVTP